MQWLEEAVIAIAADNPLQLIYLNHFYFVLVLKVFSVENDGFTEVCNMRGSKNQNLSYSSNDVAWSNIDNNILATAATNGLVSIWDLSRFGRHKQMKVYSEHKRTATTVTFHSRENYLISGSQDGTIKAFDLRNDKAINTFFR